METRGLTIDNKKLVVLDDEFLGQEFEEFRDFIFNAAGFHLSQADTYASYYEAGPYWAYTIKPDVFKDTELHNEVLRIVKEKYKNISWKISKVHVNAIQYGDTAYAHEDGNFLEGDNLAVTVLIYLNKEWDKNWGGETVFYDSTDDVVTAVLPKYKRLTIFDGRILHAGKPPSRVCLVRRMVLAIKFSGRENT
jgi:Rps23 Pro-64 3,4-dihydroxylase Tpa1-like proline 4-hydroxylase